jgi:hypothetical protein
MDDLYVKLRIADYRRKTFDDYVKNVREIVDGYDKLYDEYVTDEILSPVDSDL